MLPLAELTTLVDRLQGAKVTCIGDLMLDRYIYGEVERVSPEAPVPVLRVSGETDMLGGAGNVVRNLAALQAQSGLAAVVGDDEAGDRIQILLKELAGCSQYLVVEQERGTTIKTRCIGSHQQILRVDREQREAISEMAAEAILAHVKQALSGGACVLSDYGKGVLTEALCQAIITTAKALDCPSVVDPKVRDFGRYRGADVITPNRSELAAATGMSCSDEHGIVAAASQLREQYLFGAVVVTRSEDGLTIVDSEGVTHLPAESQEVYDVSGAGDTVVATLAAALAVEIPLAEAAQLANAAAGIAVSKLGTAVTEARELRAVLRQKQMLALESKVVSREEAAEIVADWQSAGLRVGFTNGCFDLIHPGHITLIDRARSRCDRLIVAINTDPSVSRLKGPDRPIQNEAARATVLASIGSVDLVISFDEDTPMQALQRLRPDVLFKGSDYTLEQVVGADLVQSYGGRVELIEIVPEQSTTRIVQKLRGI